MTALDLLWSSLDCNQSWMKVAGRSFSIDSCDIYLTSPEIGELLTDCGSTFSLSLLCTHTLCIDRTCSLHSLSPVTPAIAVNPLWPCCSASPLSDLNSLAHYFSLRLLSLSALSLLSFLVPLCYIFLKVKIHPKILALRKRLTRVVAV